MPPSKQIPLSGKRGQGFFATVAAEDYETLVRYKWHLSKWGYAATSIGGRKNRRTIFMHQMIMEPPPDLEVDHKDGHKLNNCRDNLRFATHTQNAQNTKVRQEKSSRFKGVAWDKARELWETKLQANGETIFIGRFTSELQAARAYNEAAQQHFGEYARLNELDDVADTAIRHRQAKAFSHARTSQYRGVYFPTSKQRWAARIQVKGKGIHLGYHDSEQEAARAYDVAARKYHGDRAFLNFPE